MIYLRGSELCTAASATKRYQPTPNLPKYIPPRHITLPKKYNKFVDIKTTIRNMLGYYVTMEVYKYLSLIACHPITLNWSEKGAAVDAPIE